MLHEVLRTICLGTDTLQPGQIVDTSTWPARNVSGLIELRRLQRAMIPTEALRSQPVDDPALQPSPLTQMFDRPRIK